MRVITAFGGYHCGECGQPLVFEPTRDLVRDGFAIGACQNGHECYDPEHVKRNCPRFQVRLRVPVQSIECEAV